MCDLLLKEGEIVYNHLGITRSSFGLIKEVTSKAQGKNQDLGRNGHTSE